MIKYEIDICFRSGFSIDDLNDHVRSNPRLIFVSKTSTKKSNKATYEWIHKRYPGRIKLNKDNGGYWIKINVTTHNQLLGAFVSWLFNNADEMVNWIEVFEGD